jgi:hypothetical protein
MNNSLINDGNKTAEEILANLETDLKVERTTVVEISDFSSFAQTVREHGRKQNGLRALIALFGNLAKKRHPNV